MTTFVITVTNRHITIKTNTVMVIKNMALIIVPATTAQREGVAYRLAAVDVRQTRGIAVAGGAGNANLL